MILSEMLLLLMFIALSGLYSGTETGLYVLGRTRLRLRAQMRQAPALRLKGLLDEPQLAISSLLLGTNVTIYLATLLCTDLLRRTYGVRAEIVSTLLLTPIIFIFAEVVPKNIFTRYADVLMYRLVGFLYISRMLFLPAAWMLNALAAAIGRPFGAKPVREGQTFDREKLISFILEGRERGTLSEYQNILAENVLRLSEENVKKVMVPLEQCILAPAEATPEEIRALSRKYHFTRFPLYKGRPEKVAGIVNILDILGDTSARKAEDVMRPAVFIPSHLSLVATLTRLKQAKQPMGIVIEEGRGAIGLVTIKDIVEEIVGELAVW